MQFNWKQHNIEITQILNITSNYVASNFLSFISTAQNFHHLSIQYDVVNDIVIVFKKHNDIVLHAKIYYDNKNEDAIFSLSARYS